MEASQEENEFDVEDDVTEMDAETPHKQLSQVDMLYQATINRHVDNNPLRRTPILIDQREFSEMQKRERLVKSLRCVRCHQLTHYGHTKGTVESVKADDFRYFLKKQLKFKKTSMVIIKLVDMFDLEGSFIPDFLDIVGTDRHDIILVANKMDLLPFGKHHQRMADMNQATAWLKQMARGKFGLTAFHSVNLVSAKTGEGVQQLVDKAHKLAFIGEQRKDVYIVGTTNVGKSSLINCLLKKKFITNDHLQGDGGVVTTSQVPGTTLGLVRFPFGRPDKRKWISLFDTPGVIGEGYLGQHLIYEELRALLPTKEVRPVSIKLFPGDSLILGALARLDYVTGERECYFTVMVSPLVTIHKTKTMNLDEKWKSHAARGNKEKGLYMAPPFEVDRLKKLQFESFDDAKFYDFGIRGKGWKEAMCDIVIPGVGWVALTGSEMLKVRTYIACGVRARIRQPLLPYEARREYSPGYGHDPRRLPTPKLGRAARLRGTRATNK